MEKRMGTLTDDKDGNISPDPLHSPVRNTETMDEDRIPDTETPYGKCPTRCTADKNSYTVKGSENSTIRDSTVIGVLNKTVIKNKKKQEGVTCNVTAEGAKPRVKISVPAEDGGTVIHVDCTNGQLRHLSYYRKVKNIENTFGSTWTFRNIFADFMALIFNGGKSDDFFDLFEKLKERYGCEVHKVFQKCLVIEFLHETEEGRDRMIKEKETVKQMFQTFIEGIKPNAPSCTLEVTTEKETTPLSDKQDTESKHIEQDVSVPSTSKSEKAQAPGMMSQEYKKKKRFQSLSYDGSLPRKMMKYSVENKERDDLIATMALGIHHTPSPNVSPPSPETIFQRIRASPLHEGLEPFPVSQVNLPSSVSASSVSVPRITSMASIPYMFPRITSMASIPYMFPRITSMASIPYMFPRITNFGLQPIPVSQVPLCGCRRCSWVFWNCANELSTLPNLFSIHFAPTWEDVLLSESQLQFTKILSAFRNSQGGILIVHQRNTPDSVDSLHKFINKIFSSVLTHDLVTCEVFKSQQIRNFRDVFRIDVEPSEMYVTHDYKTKFPSLSTGKFENASNERIRRLLFSPRTTESTVVALQGISSSQQNVEYLRLRYTRPIPMLSDPSEPPRHMLNVLVDDIDVDDIITSRSVPKHITSLSKKKSGGSMFFVMAGLKLEDTPLRQQERFKARLMNGLKANLRVQKNKHSKVSLQDIDVFKIGLSKDADNVDCILEIAVGHVNGCVFYDPQGPESYKIEGEKIVRLPIERWVEEAFE